MILEVLFYVLHAFRGIDSFSPLVINDQSISA